MSRPHVWIINVKPLVIIWSPGPRQDNGGKPKFGANWLRIRSQRKQETWHHLVILWASKDTRNKQNLNSMSQTQFTDSISNSASRGAAVRPHTSLSDKQMMKQHTHLLIRSDGNDDEDLTEWSRRNQQTYERTLKLWASWALLLWWNYFYYYFIFIHRWWTHLKSQMSNASEMIFIFIRFSCGNLYRLFYTLAPICILVLSIKYQVVMEPTMQSMMINFSWKGKINLRLIHIHL
jgi:hypothetical protein